MNVQLPSVSGTEQIKVKLPSVDDVSKLAHSFPPRKQLDPTDWQIRYLAPGTEQNPGRFWKLPPLSMVLDDFKYCGGQTSKFVMSITNDPDLQERLMMELHEELAKEENEFWAKRFIEIVTIGKKVRLGLGIDQALNDFRDSGEMNNTLLSKLGAQAMPETFGNSAQAKAADEKSAQDEQNKAVEDHIADLE